MRSIFCRWSKSADIQIADGTQPEVDLARGEVRGDLSAEQTVPPPPARHHVAILDAGGLAVICKSLGIIGQLTVVGGWW